MPIHRATGPRGGKGWQYGTTGKVYPTSESPYEHTSEPFYSYTGSFNDFIIY